MTHCPAITLDLCFVPPTMSCMPWGCISTRWNRYRIPDSNSSTRNRLLEARRSFEEQDCARCHSGDNYGGELLTPADGFDIPESYFGRFEIHDESAETDASLATKTRKGTGFYKVPTLRGLWYRGLFGHDGSCASLEDWFDAKRLKDNYEPTGCKGPGVSRGVPFPDMIMDSICPTRTKRH